MRSLHRVIGQATKVVGGAVLILMALQIVIDVILRNTVGAGFPATTDLVSKYYMILVSFLPVAYAEAQRRHVEASIFTDMLPRPMHGAVYLLGFVLSLIVYGILAYGTAKEALIQTSRGAYIEAGTILFPTWPGYWILPVCFGLMALVLVGRVAEVLTGRFVDVPAEQALIQEPLNQVE